MENIINEGVCVYLHINPKNQEIFYVGIGKKDRPYNRTGRNDSWKEYVTSIFFNYNIDIIHENLDYIKAFEIEKKLILKYGRKDKGTGTLLNQSDGGEGCSIRVLYLEREIKELKEEYRQKENRLFLLEKEILNNVSLCKNEEEFYQKYYEDFLLAKRLNLMEKVKYIFELNLINSHKKKLSKIENYLNIFSDNF